MTSADSLTEPLLRVRDVTVRRGRTDVISGASLSVRPGQVVALAGLNGAGKTTLVRAVSGLVRPRSGEITLDGVSIVGRPPAQIVRSGLGHVPPGGQVFPGLSVSENLMLGAYHVRDEHRRRERERLVMETFPDLVDRGDQRAGTLSGGEQQLVAIARTLMAQPGMLILDEPSTGLSAASLRLLSRGIDSLRDRGTAVLLVEARLELIRRTASRIVLLDHGRVVLDSTLDTAHDHPVIDALGGFADETGD